MFKKLSVAFLMGISAFFAFCAFINANPSQAGCGWGRGGSCQGNMNIANWGPSNYVERPIYPMRGCGGGACQKGWRSAIIYPPPSMPYGGKVVASPPIGCGIPVGCGAPVGCGPQMGGMPWAGFAGF